MKRWLWCVLIFVQVCAHKNLLIYHGEGTDVSSVEALKEAFMGRLPEECIQLVTAEDLSSSDWHDTTGLLVIPGGKIGEMMQVLNGFQSEGLNPEGALASIQSYVKAKHGGFMGVCGGAFLGSARTWCEGVNLPGDFSVRMGFCPYAISVGPAFEHTEEPMEVVLKDVDGAIFYGNWLNSGVMGLSAKPCQGALEAFEYVYPLSTSITRFIHDASLISQKSPIAALIFTPDQSKDYWYGHGPVCLTHVHPEWPSEQETQIGPVLIEKMLQLCFEKYNPSLGLLR